MNKQLFKKKLREQTGCSIQHNGWTCGSCFFCISETLNNNDWNAVLNYRGDYLLEDLNKMRIEDKREPLTKEMIKESLNKVWELIK